MDKVRDDLLKILNQALASEHTTRARYSTLAVMIAATLAKIKKAHMGNEEREMTEINLNDEKEAVAFYKLLGNKIGEYRQVLQAEFERLEHEMQNVIRDEQIHLDRLSWFVGQLEKMVEKKRQRGFFNSTENLYTLK